MAIKSKKSRATYSIVEGIANYSRRDKTGKLKAITRFNFKTRLTAAVVRYIAILTPYVESEMLGLSEIVKTGDICLDVGAAAGLYTLELSRLVGPEGRVLSFEPLTFSQPILSRILAAKTQLNVTHENIALGIKPGKAAMSVPIGRHRAITGRSFLEREASGLGSNSEFPKHMRVNVEVDTIDQYCKKEKLKKLDFIKIDIEGAELHALKGGQKSIKRFKPAILVEIELRHLKRFGFKTEDIVSWLKQIGYNMYVWDNGWHEAKNVTLNSRNYLFRVK